jgi:hypothetical protein
VTGAKPSRTARGGAAERALLTERLEVDRARAVELVEACGGHVDEAVGGREAAQALIPPGTGLPVDAVSGDRTLLAASR